MKRTMEISNHENIIGMIKRAFQDELTTTYQSLWNVVKSKDEEINILTREKKLDEEEKVKMMSRITELEDHVAILTEEVERKDEALMNQLSRDNRGKPQILWDENEKIRSELNTLKHIKMKDDKDYQERIESLTKLKDHRERDLETLKIAQTKYFATFSEKLEWFTCAVKEKDKIIQEKDEIIKSLNQKKNANAGETELSSSVKENNKVELFDEKTEKANEKCVDTAMTSTRTYDDLEAEEDPTDDQIRLTGVEIPERCPMPGCKSDVKFSKKSLGNLKGHLSRHYTTQITQNFPFKPKQACPLCLKKNKRHLILQKTGHVYHLGIVHRQIELYATEEERHILKFIK